MEKVREQARDHGEPTIEGLALTALAEASLKRDADPEGAQALVDEALEVLKKDEDPVARFDALAVRATVGAWQGSLADTVRYMERAYGIALDAGRKDLQTVAAQALAQIHIIGLELDEAELLLTRALELAGQSGSVRARVGATLSYGWFLAVKGEIDAAETLFEEVRATATELGVEPSITAALAKLGWIARLRGDYKKAEKLLREALRMTSVRGDRGILPGLQYELAIILADGGKVEEAERLAREAQANTLPGDHESAVGSVLALGAVRAAQGRDDEAEQQYLSALAIAQESDFKVLELEPLERLTAFLRDRGRPEEAATYVRRSVELSPPDKAARIA
jgi:tetratricopeptide (TPR) repeat protein